MTDIILVKLESIGSETDTRGFHPPFGILYLADALEHAGYSVKVLHEEATLENLDNLSGLISREKPSLVGFSVITGPQIIPTLKASEEIKSKFGLPVIWGGIQPSLLPRMVLANHSVDVIVIGEGEKTMVELARLLIPHGKDTTVLKTVAGIGYRDGSRIMLNPPREFQKKLNQYFAAWRYLDIERYICPEIYLDRKLGGGERAFAINTSRGCPWRCGYCYNVAFNIRTFRAHSAAHVISEIEELKKRHHISAIRFSDDYFFSDRARALEIIHKIEIPWTSTIRVNDLVKGGDDFVRDLAESKCALLRCGVESGSQRILDFIQKDITLAQIGEAAELCEKHRIKIGFFFMLGFPGETWEDICSTLDLMDELESKGVHVTAALPSIFCPYPGTPLLDVARENGFQVPESLMEWGKTNDEIVKHTGELPPYVDRRVERIINYLRMARAGSYENPILSVSAKIFSRIARWRWKNRFFFFPLDWHIANWGKKAFRGLGKS